MRNVSIPLAAIGLSLLTASVGLADTPAAPACDVYLTPFTVLGNDASLQWVGKAVEQNLMTDLARAKLHPQGAEKPIANTADAQAAAKAAGATYFISGSYQVADQQVRFTGQVIDTATGNVLGGITTTGAMRDLFKMEDDLSTQAVAELTKQTGVANNANQPANKPAPPVPVQAPAAPAAPVNPPVIVQIIQPGAGVAPPSRYQGSALEQYVNSNRTPSSDYSNLPASDSSTADNFTSTPGSNYNVGFNNFWITGYMYGPGGGYPLPPFGKYGYGTAGHPHHRPGDADH